MDLDPRGHFVSSGWGRTGTSSAAKESPTFGTELSCEGQSVVLIPDDPELTRLTNHAKVLGSPLQEVCLMDIEIQYCSG